VRITALGMAWVGQDVSGSATLTTPPSSARSVARQSASRAAAGATAGQSGSSSARTAAAASAGIQMTRPVKARCAASASSVAVPSSVAVMSVWLVR
jgi:hypothetical protein